MAGNGKAHSLACGIVDGDLGLYQPRYVNDAENDEEEERRCESKLDDALSCALVAPPGEEG